MLRVPRFHRRTHERCTDCDIRGALHADGHILRDKQGALLSRGCSTCGGTGKVPVADTHDPYELRVLAAG